MLFTFLSIVGSLFLFLILLWYVKQYRFFKELKRIPGPLPWPIVGNGLEFTSLEAVLPTLLAWREKHGSLYKMTIGYSPPNLIITDYKFIEFLLGSTDILSKSLTYKFVQGWLGTGLLTSTGMKWKKHRKMITPAFHFKILEQFVDVFEKNGNILLESLKKEIWSNSVNVYPYVTLMALDIICETALGTEINAQKDEGSEYAKCVQEMCSLVITRSLNPFLKSELLYKFSNTYKKEKRALEILHSTTLSVIKKKKAEAKETKPVERNNEYGIKKKLAFLDLLMESTIDGRPLSDAELKEEVATFMFAGHDTTASTISFTLYNLSLHSDVQNKAFDEIKSIFSDDMKRTCTYTDLQNMKYLEATIKETLRLYPSVPIIGRTHHEDFVYDGTTIPAGTPLIILLYGIMRDPMYFPEPEKFKPERFLVKGGGSHLPFAFIPFSAGPRNCLGQKFGMLEVKSIISKILRKYEILPTEPASKLSLSLEITLRSSTGINIKIRERKM